MNPTCESPFNFCDCGCYHPTRADYELGDDFNAGMSVATAGGYRVCRIGKTMIDEDMAPAWYEGFDYAAWLIGWIPVEERRNLTVESLLARPVPANTHLLCPLCRKRQKVGGHDGYCVECWTDAALLDGF